MKKIQEVEKVIYNAHSLLNDLKCCSIQKDLLWGRGIHAKTVETVYDTNKYVTTALIKMYAKCGSMTEAHVEFNRMHDPDVVSWNVLILGYAECGKGLDALKLFSGMENRGCNADSVTYIAAVKACTSLATTGNEDCLQLGREIHAGIGFHLTHQVQSSLIEMYAKCGSMTDARRLFDTIEKPDVVSWTALLLGYVDNGESSEALELFQKMKDSGCLLNSVTYVAALKACTSLAINGNATAKQNCMKLGKAIHLEIGCHLNHYVQNSLIDMYASCGCMVNAREVFDDIERPDVVSWNVLLMGYAENGEGIVAIDLLNLMNANGCRPNSMTYVAALKACTSISGTGKRECLEKGRKIHGEIGCHMNNHIHSTLVDMYAKCGSMSEALRVFESLQEPDTVSWTALLLGYADNGQGLLALELFARMKARGCVPNYVTYAAALKVCGFLGALPLGRKLHLELNEYNAHVVTCLVDFYAKCGSIAEARTVFDSHPTTRDAATWNALIAGYGSFASDSVFELFEAMKEDGFQPDSSTFSKLLLYCNHAGLVKKAREYLEAMPVQYGVSPSSVHYKCMVDALGRANQLSEAVVMLREMPCNPDAATWTVLLSACSKWKNAEIGRLAFQSWVDIIKDASAYVLLASIYGSRGMWEEQERVFQTVMNFNVRGQAHATNGEFLNNFDWR